MYTGTCDVAELGPCALKIRKEELVGKKEKENIEVEEETIGKWVFSPTAQMGVTSSFPNSKQFVIFCGHKPSRI